METAAQLSYQLLYSAHPFASRGLGTAESLAQITPEDVRAAYRQYLLPNAAVMAMVGRCNAEEARGQVQALFGLWRITRVRHDRRVLLPALTSSHLVVREAQGQKHLRDVHVPRLWSHAARLFDHAAVGCVTRGRNAVTVIPACAGRITSRDYVATNYPSQRSCSLFSVYALTDSATIEETKSALAETIADLQVKPVSESDLQRAKALLKGRYLLSHQYSAQYAFDLAWYELVNLGVVYEAGLPENIDAVTVQDIQHVTRTYFTHYYLVVIIPQTSRFQRRNHQTV